MKKLLYLGHFSSVGAEFNMSASSAGDIVQKQILYDSRALLGEVNVKAISLEPKACWPKGPIIVPPDIKNGCYFPGFINLPLIKNFIFAIFALYILIRFKPNIILQYNSYLFENIIMLFAKTLFNVKAFSIIQDVRIGSNFSKYARYQDKISNYLLRYFTLVVPVTDILAEHLKLKPNKRIIFSGGITDFGFNCLKRDSFQSNHAVFAGALERHNGIHKLLDVWTDIGVELHIFGRGSLKNLVEHAAKTHPNIIYHGFCSQDEIMKWQISSKYNICLRYSDGLNADYFFPSKFFNVSLCPGLVIFNDFTGVPKSFKNLPGICKSDLSNIKEVISVGDNEIKNSASERKQYILEHNSWSSLLFKIFNYS